MVQNNNIVDVNTRNRRLILVSAFMIILIIFFEYMNMRKQTISTGIALIMVIIYVIYTNRKPVV